MSIARSGGADVVIDASLDAVWQVVADPTRTGEWSAECQSVSWGRGAEAGVVGARFRGRNRSGLIRWSRTCELTEVDPPRRIAWRTLPTGLYRDSTVWCIELEAAERGTRVRLAYRLTYMARWLEPVVSRTNPGHADRTDALAADLRRLGVVAAGLPARTVRGG